VARDDLTRYNSVRYASLGAFYLATHPAAATKNNVTSGYEFRDPERLKVIGPFICLEYDLDGSCG